MSTLADLIRAHQANPRTLYVAPETDKTSQPGSYDQSASQRSPALDRRIEKQLARRLGEDRGLDPDDLDKIDDFEDLNDLLNGDDPDLPDPDDPEIPDPEDPDLPDPEDPETPDLPVEPPIMGYGTAYALHSGSISKTDDGGAKWANFTGSPADPIGFSILGDDAYVATATGVFYGDALSGWRELSLGNPNIQISGFANGGFEGGLAGWETIDGDSPRTGWLPTILPTEGNDYLRRDWVTYTDGEFTLAQTVTLTPAEIAALGSGTLQFSGDVWGAGGAAELRIEAFRSRTLMPDADDVIFGSYRSSSTIKQLEISCSDTPEISTTAQISFVHDIDWPNYNPSGRIDLSMSFRVQLGGSGGAPVYTSSVISQTDVLVADAIIQGGEFRQDATFTLTGPAGGTITITVPAGWRYPILIPQGLGHGSTSTNSQYGLVAYGTGWQVLGQASSSEILWNRVSASAGSIGGSTSQVRCVIEVTGSPADAYVDNCRLEIIRDSVAPEVQAIGGEYVSINSSLYKMSPTGLTHVRGLEFSPDGIDDNGSSVIAWSTGDYCIYIGDEDATYTLNQPFVEVISDAGGALVFMSSGEIWRRRNDPDYPGWDTLGTLSGPTVDIASADGAYIAISDPAIDLGSLRTSRDLASWRIVSTESYGNRVVSMGMTVMTWTTGSPQVYWFDTSGWHTVGNLKAGIIDISTG